MLLDTQVSQAVEVGSVLIPLDRETRVPTKGVREVRFAVTNLVSGLPRFERAGMGLRCRMDSWQKRPNCPAAPSLADYPAQREHADYTAKNNQPADYPAWTDHTVACGCLTGYAVLAEFLAEAAPLNSIRAASHPSVPSRRERGAEDRGGVRDGGRERSRTSRSGRHRRSLSGGGCGPTPKESKVQSRLIYANPPVHRRLDQSVTLPTVHGYRDLNICFYRNSNRSRSTLQEP